MRLILNVDRDTMSSPMEFREIVQNGRQMKRKIDAHNSRNKSQSSFCSFDDDDDDNLFIVTTISTKCIHSPQYRNSSKQYCGHIVQMPTKQKYLVNIRMYRSAQIF